MKVIVLLIFHNTDISHTKCSSGTTKKFPIYQWLYIAWYIYQWWYIGGYFSANKCTGTVECSCYIFQLNSSTYSKWKFLDCATVAFSEQYEYVRTQIYEYYMSLT